MRHRSLGLVAVLVGLTGCSSSGNNATGSPGADGGGGGGGDASTDASDAAVGAADAGTSIQGSVAGQTITIADAYVYDESYDFAGAGVPVVVYALKFTSYSDGCTLQQQSDSHHANAQYLKFYFGHEGSSPPGVGTYPVYLLANLPGLLTQPSDAGAGDAGAPDAGGPPLAAAQLKTFNGTCSPTITDATSGTLVVTDVSSGAKGTFSLAFPNGDSLTGTFDVSTCVVSPPSAIPICEQ